MTIKGNEDMWLGDFILVDKHQAPLTLYMQTTTTTTTQIDAEASSKFPSPPLPVPQSGNTNRWCGWVKRVDD